MEGKKAAGGEAPAPDPNPWAVAPHAKCRTPDHPPYAEMVRVALLALAEEEEGSTEAAISAYIVSAFSGLPPGHASLLPYYLSDLVSSGFLSVPSPGRYLLLPPSPPSPQNPNPNPNPNTNPNPNPNPISEPSLTSSIRRRGRPPKNAVAAAPPPPPLPAVEAPVRRGPGRPRKRAVVAAADGEVSVAVKEKREKKREEEG